MTARRSGLLPKRVRVMPGFRKPKWIAAMEVTSTCRGCWENRGFNRFSGS
jgi:hypothetical protein